MNIPDPPFPSVPCSSDAGPSVSNVLHDSCILTQDSSIPAPAPKTDDPVSIVAFCLLKGTVHSTRILTLKRFVKFGSSVRFIFLFPLIYKLLVSHALLDTVLSLSLFLSSCMVKMSGAPLQPLFSPGTKNVSSL